MKFCKQDHGSGENSKEKKEEKKASYCSDGSVKNISNVHYNINNVFHQKVIFFLVLKPYINIYNISEQQIFINL